MAEAKLPENQAREKDPKQDDQLRTTLANTYTFVRSREINKVITTFTFDHYIDEAKRAIKGQRNLASASGQAVGTRPSQLPVLETLETDFAANYSKMMEQAIASDKAGEQQTPQDTQAEALPEETVREKEAVPDAG